VPQFIETEDKVVGPLSLKQFFYLAGGAGISFTLYFSVATWLWFVLSIFIASLAVGLAFIKVNGRPLVRILVSAARYYWQPHRYVWQPNQPKTQKTPESLREVLGGTIENISLEKIISGFALKSAQLNVEVGSKNTFKGPIRTEEHKKERYEIFRGMTGDKRAARRVDYR